MINHSHIVAPYPLLPPAQAMLRWGRAGSFTKQTNLIQTTYEHVYQLINSYNLDKEVHNVYIYEACILHVLHIHTDPATRSYCEEHQ